MTDSTPSFVVFTGRTGRAETMFITAATGRMGATWTTGTTGMARTTRRRWRLPQVLLMTAVLAGCAGRADLPLSAGEGPDPKLPPPRTSWIPTVNVAKAVGWPEGGKPTAAEGLTVTAFASGLDHPRWLHVRPNGDVLVAESNAPAREPNGMRERVARWVMSRAGAGVPSPDRITLLRDTDGDGQADVRSVLLANLHSPFGMALIGSMLYVANADGIVRVPYRLGDERIAAAPQKVTDLPSGINHHWTKNLIASPDGQRLYATVGSNSNIGENGMDAEEGRAAIWEIDPTTGSKRLFASGLRNPNGMAWEPGSKTLWTVVNERDELGSDLVPDYLTSVRDGGFYGWPYSYFGANVDARVKPQRPDLVSKALVPDYGLGTHTAALGLASATGNRLGPAYGEGMFIGRHGSWNRRPAAGYDVVFVPFSQGKPSAMPQPVLSGFLDDAGQARGRPVGVAVDRAGGLLVADDVGNVVWRVAAARSGGR